MSEMVERVARAMCESDGSRWDAADFNETANGDTPEEQREYWREKARVAIAAMREPTKGMVISGDIEKDNCVDEDFSSNADGERSWYTTISSDLPARVFRTMIDAALE